MTDPKNPEHDPAADALGEALAEHRARVDQVLPSGDPGAIKQLYVELGQLLEDAVGSDPGAIPALSFPEIAPVLGGLAADLGPRVLDAGCGPNPIFSIMLAPSRFMVSLDISWSIVRLAVSRAEAAGVKVHGVVGDLEALPFREGVFDGSVCEDTIEHLPDDRSGASELARVLAPGGRVILGTPNRVRLDVLIARWRHRRSGERRPASSYYAATSHLREYTWRSLERLVRPWFNVRQRASVGWTHERYARTASRLVRHWPFRQFGRMVLLDLEKRTG
ncbi:MAG: methyltransferase domain-containing protein [Actinomycetota bacterium]